MPLIPFEPAEKLHSFLRNSSLILRADSVLIFTCGASSGEANSGSAREKVMRYAQRHIPDVQFFEAEDIFQRLDSERQKDLLSLEEELANFSDCILIFLESPGAQSELGAFAMYDELAKIILTVNKDKYKGEGSFITDGPIAKVDEVSKFGSTIYANFDAILTSMSEIEDRLSNIRRRRGKRIEIESYDSLRREKPKIKMLFIADLISLYSPIKYRELIRVMGQVFGEYSFDVKTDVAFLESVGIIKRINKKLLVRNIDEKGQFFKYSKNYDWSRNRSTIVRDYFRKSRDRFDSLVERVG